nr:MAG TPA: hypothetical protein [Caudoviricetes sp.]
MAYEFWRQGGVLALHRPTKHFTEQNVCFIIMLSLLSAEVIGGDLGGRKRNLQGTHY